MADTAATLPPAGHESRFDVKTLLARHGAWLALALLVAVAGVGLLLYAGVDGLEHAHFNERRCRAIERDMVSASPRRSDGPALFQALACRPETNAPVGFPAKGRPAT